MSGKRGRARGAKKKQQLQQKAAAAAAAQHTKPAALKRGKASDSAGPNKQPRRSEYSHTHDEGKAGTNTGASLHQVGANRKQQLSTMTWVVDVLFKEKGRVEQQRWRAKMIGTKTTNDYCSSEAGKAKIDELMGEFPAALKDVTKMTMQEAFQAQMLERSGRGHGNRLEGDAAQLGIIAPVKHLESGKRSAGMATEVRDDGEEGEQVKLGRCSSEDMQKRNAVLDKWEKQVTGEYTVDMESGKASGREGVVLELEKMDPVTNQHEKMILELPPMQPTTATDSAEDVINEILRFMLVSQPEGSGMKRLYCRSTPEACFTCAC
eukprot:COSAG04_NODE_1051_length_8554_cov_151.236310_11_plen_321_part_00